MLQSDQSESRDLPRESPRTILFQFVIFPLGVVLIGVLVFLFFGSLASDDHSVQEYLNDIRSGSNQRRWQAAYQLTLALKRGGGEGLSEPGGGGARALRFGER